ncbi:hypothetical protein [Variovorax gracilis]|uniref:hypothetical protein n=1 Tax=Variovorax gracilis TaxID=3053502 RepID=UPI002578937A|nr:hypothetical protein [Variovorax sp. J22R24]
MDLVADMGRVAARVRGKAVLAEVRQAGLGQDAAQGIAARDEDHHEALCDHCQLIEANDKT